MAGPIRVTIMPVGPHVAPGAYVLVEWNGHGSGRKWPPRLVDEDTMRAPAAKRWRVPHAIVPESGRMGEICAVSGARSLRAGSVQRSREQFQGRHRSEEHT